MIFKKLRFKNILSFGNSFTEINLDTKETVLINGLNAAGKCLDKFTKIEIEIPEEILDDFNSIED